jgi:hypothetical protein
MQHIKAMCASNLSMHAGYYIWDWFVGEINLLSRRDISWVSFIGRIKAQISSGSDGCYAFRASVVLRSSHFSFLISLQQLVLRKSDRYGYFNR